jgi:cytochrome c biogenesis protein CcdA
LVLAAVKHQVAGAFVLLVAYGVGAALPLLAIAYGGRYLSQKLLNLRSHSNILQRIGGVMVSATAIAILLGWDVQVQLWLAPIFPALPL